MTRLGVPGQNIDTLAYVDGRLSTIPVIQAPRRPTVNDKKYPLGCEWRTDKNVTAPTEEGEFWKLVRFESSGDATWVRFAGGDSGAVISLTGDDSVIIEADSDGNIDILGLAVANATNAKPLYFDGDAALYNVTAEIQVACDRTGKPGDKLDAGICSFSDDQFLVDADGYVLLAGGVTAPILTLTDDNGAPTGPTGGDVVLRGTTVANATNAKPVFIDGTPGSYLIETMVQVAAAITGAPGDKNDAGLCSFNDTQFTVDVDGYVSLAGGGLAIDSFSTDVAGPVAPDGTGNVDITGTSIFSDGTVANTLTLNAQATLNTFLLGAGANTNVTELGPLTNGQLIIGATGAAPTASTLTAGTGITITNAANSITIASSDVVNGLGTYNIGFSTSLGTFTIHGADGAALSASNKGYVSINSKANPGYVVSVEVTTNQTFIDDAGVSTIVGNLFGFLAGDTQTSYDVPFFLYAVLNDAENAISFMISRQAGRSISPVAASIGKTGSAVGDTDFAFFALSNPTITDYESNPCLMIGSFRMRLTTAGGDWTVQTLTNEDGIGKYQEQRIFNLEGGILGADAGTHWWANGGTAPIYTISGTDTLYSYRILTNGSVWVNYIGRACTTDGVGAVQARIVSPMSADDNPWKIFHSTCYGEANLDNAGSNNKMFVNGTVNFGTDHNIYFVYNDAVAGTSGNMLNTDITSNVTAFNFSGFFMPRTEA